MIGRNLLPRASFWQAHTNNSFGRSKENGGQGGGGSWRNREGVKRRGGITKDGREEEGGGEKVVCRKGKCVKGKESMMEKGVKGEKEGVGGGVEGRSV